MGSPRVFDLSDGERVRLTTAATVPTVSRDRWDVRPIRRQG
jgi:hypothetical protein